MPTRLWFCCQKVIEMHDLEKKKHIWTSAKTQTPDFLLWKSFSKEEFGWILQSVRKSEWLTLKDLENSAVEFQPKYPLTRRDCILKGYIPRSPLDPWIHRQYQILQSHAFSILMKHLSSTVTATYKIWSQAAKWAQFFLTFSQTDLSNLSVKLICLFLGTFTLSPNECALHLLSWIYEWPASVLH